MSRAQRHSRNVLKQCCWWLALAVLSFGWAGAGAAEKSAKPEKKREHVAIEVVSLAGKQSDQLSASANTAEKSAPSAREKKAATEDQPKDASDAGIISLLAQATVGPVKPLTPPAESTVPLSKETESGAAGNVADVTGKAAAPVGPLAPAAPGQAGPAEPGKTAPAAPLPGAGAPAFPGFAEQQPGFIPDTQPGELFVRPGGAEAPGFESMLGESNLPEEENEGVVGAQQQSPGSDLEEGFARVVVPTGTIEGSTETKQFHIEGGLIVYYREVMITGDKADIDEKKELANISGNVVITDPKYTMKTDELRINFGEKRFEATGFVQFNKIQDPKKSEPNLSLPKKDRLREYFSGQPFELYCTKLFYNWDTKEMSAVEGVRIVHPFFNGTMELLEYNDDSKSYAMSGKVELEITKYDWIFATKVADEKDEPKIRALTDNITKVTCEQLNYSDATDIAEFYALPGEQVFFDQTKRGVRASYIEVNDKTKDFYAEGTAENKAVFTQVDGEWLYNADLVKREDAPKEVNDALANPLQAESKSITYNFDRRRIEMRGGVYIKSQESEVTADELVQDEAAKFFLLHGNVVIKAGADNQVYAAQVYVDTSTDTMTFVGLVQGQSKSADLAAMAPAAQTGAAGQAGPTGQPGQAGQAGQAAPGGFRAQPGVFGQGGGQLPPRTGTNVAERE